MRGPGREGTDPELSDSGHGDLVRRVRAGDDGALTVLVRRLSPALWRVARSYRLDTASCEDVVQSTWLALHEHLGQLRDPDAVAGWLCVTTRRLCLAELRRTNRLDLLGPGGDLEGRRSGEESQGHTDPAGLACHRARNRALRAALHRLPERDQLLLGLLVSDPPVPYADIARSLGTTIGSIGPTRARALARLRRELAVVGYAELDALAG